MKNDAVCEATVSVDDDVDTGDPEAELNVVDLLEGAISTGEVIEELGNAGEVLIRVELELACFSEKLVNLSVLAMHVANKESDFEAFASVEEHILGDSIEKALEFDLLSGILDSEARELDKFTTTLQADVNSAGEIVSSLKHFGENFMEMEGKVRDAEQTLKQSQDQVSEIRKQSAKFQRIISSSNQDDNRSSVRGADFPEDDDLLNMNAKIQTAGQQRHVLRMLEKSLAREIDLEKKLTESRQIEEELKLWLHSSEREVFYLEEEAADVWGRWFQADNTSQVLLGISKELLGRLQIFQFNLNGSLLRESELRSKLEHSTDQLKVKEIDFHKLKTSSADFNESLLARTNSLKARLRETEDKLIIANSEAFTLREKLSSLENLLKEPEFRLLNEKVSADGSRDQHNVLSSEINEMEDLIVDLKQKSSEAESRAESTKSKCKMLGETNMDLNEVCEELCFLEGSNGISDKVNSLERLLRESNIHLQHAVVSAEASQEKQSMLYSIIGDKENLIKDLKLKVSKAEIRVTTAEEKCVILSESNAQLKEELRSLRGRLESLEASLHQSKDMKMAIARDIGIRTKVFADLVMQLTIERERLHKQWDKTRENITVGKTRVGSADSTSEFEKVRRIDAGILNFKHVFMAMLVFLISVVAYIIVQQQTCHF